MKNKAEQLKEEKDFIILRASNYHYDLGIEHERERISELINDLNEVDFKGEIKGKVILISKEKLKAKLNLRNQTTNTKEDKR